MKAKRKGLDTYIYFLMNKYYEYKRDFYHGDTKTRRKNSLFVILNEVKNLGMVEILRRPDKSGSSE